MSISAVFLMMALAKARPVEGSVTINYGITIYDGQYNSCDMDKLFAAALSLADGSVPPERLTEVRNVVYRCADVMRAYKEDQRKFFEAQAKAAGVDTSEWKIAP